MNEARPYASLSSGLLARKGAAKPAMRPQSYGNLEDLGWNDMGYGAEAPQPAPAPEHVPSSIAALTPAPKSGRSHGGGDEGHAGHEESYQVDEDAAEAFEAAAEETFEAAEEEPFAAEEESFEAAEPVALEALEPETFEAPEPEIFAAPEPETFGAPEPETFEAPHVVTQQRAILEQFEPEAEPAPERRTAARAEIVPLPKREAAAAADARKSAFTLRLDTDRHLRLRLACAVTGSSAQQIVARALDEALATIPEIEALASQVPVKGRASAKRN